MTVKQEINAQTKKGENFSAVHLGKMSNLDSYELHVPRLNRTVRGKVFIKDLLSFTGMQISVNKLPAGASGICHQHKESEELQYICVQAKENSLNIDTFEDGIPATDPVTWPN
jgi:hypothetical protein